MSIAKTQLTHNFGLEIAGIDLAAETDQAVFDELFDELSRIFMPGRNSIRVSDFDK